MIFIGIFASNINNNKYKYVKIIIIVSYYHCYKYCLLLVFKYILKINMIILLLYKLNDIFYLNYLIIYGAFTTFIIGILHKNWDNNR